MKDLSVFSFGDYSQYLTVAMSRERNRFNRQTSLTQWSRKLGYKSPRSIAMVLKKIRLPTAEMIGRMSDLFHLSDSEHRYFELLVQLEREKKTGKDFTPTLKKMECLNPSNRSALPLTAEQFAYLSEWYHVVVKQLISCPAFRERPEWVCDQLRGKISSDDFLSALQRMLRLGILKRDPRNRRLNVVVRSMRTTEDIPSSAIRKHHKEMLARASEALEEQPVEEREITSKTLRVKPEDMPAAKEAIRRFKRQFEKRFECADSNSVYQLNIQFFSHSKRSPKP